MANKSDYDSDHGEDYQEKSNDKIFAEIERLEKQKAELQRRNERSMLEQKLKELKGSVNTLKSGKTSPGSSKNKSRHSASSRESEFAGFSGLSELADNSLSRGKIRDLQSIQNQLLDRAGTSGLNVGLHLQAESEESEDSDGPAGKNLDRVMSAQNKRKLQENRDTLVENILPDDIFNDLIANKILTTADCSRIKEKNTREAINEELLNNLARRSDRAFYVFVNSLRKTLQGYLADLLVPQPKAKNRKRRREAGELNINVDCEDVVPQNRKKQLCLCQEVEEQILTMARTAYRNIRRHDMTPAAFEQFKKELSQTNDIVKDSMEIMHTLKILCKHGRTVDGISMGSVIFTLKCTTLYGVKDLWSMYTSGTLLIILQRGLVTNYLKHLCRARDIKLRVRIPEEEYLQCLRELESKDKQGFESPKTPRERVRPYSYPSRITRSKPEVSMENAPKKSNSLSKIFQVEPRRAFKEIQANQSAVMSRCFGNHAKVTTVCEKVLRPQRTIFYNLRSHVDPNS
ncbi:hypothetical protein ScPMuIL_003263 [Solemya velum]